MKSMYSINFISPYYATNKKDYALAKKIATEILSEKRIIGDAIDILQYAAGFILFTPLTSEVPEIETQSEDL